MGIRYLNRFLSNRCSDKSISKKSFTEFRNKTLVIDTSIYLYRFVESNMLIEGFYNMISIFRKYHITPVFVFDGKPPVEKKELLEKRRIEKDAAEKIYNDLKTQLTEMTTPTPDAQPLLENAETRERKTEIMNEMETLKKRFVRIKPSDIQRVKDLITSYGALCIESAGEADQLCAYLVYSGHAWACVSDDMDMFLYGCARVVRHISLVNHTGILYDTPAIFNELNISYEAFRDIAILSGTDYNIHQKISLTETIKWYYVYNSRYWENLENEPNDVSFYDWIAPRAGYVIQKDKLDRIRSMFDMSLYGRTHDSELQHVYTLLSGTRGTNKTALHNVLEQDGFIFISK